MVGKTTGPTIKAMRALTTRGGGGDYHDQAAGHWIDGQIATPMSKYPAYREQRNSFGLNVLGSLVIEVEADDGTVGFAVTTGGEIGAWIAENHLARFVEGSPLDDLETIWDQMFNASLFYGRRGIVLNVISGIDLALWDLKGRIRQEPVWHLLGGKVREELTFYATGARPDLAKQMGFVGGKMPLKHAPCDGQQGLDANVGLLEDMRSKVGDDFWLMYDCWMALDLDYATRLGKACAAHGLKWIEEALPPDDYWGYANLRTALRERTQVTTGEHEATRWGFKMLIEMECCDLLQPDVGWCGGMSELLHIAKLADEAGLLVIPHGSSVYSYHFVTTCPNSPFAEFLMMAPQADKVVPMFNPLLVGEPVPEKGKLKVPDTPGFGVELNRDLAYLRPHAR
ncbi:MAG: L-rhamnonate dehydratase [Hyphomicrobiales bacterium]|jgi:L-rhamnonate dehydratase